MVFPFGSPTYRASPFDADTSEGDSALAPKQGHYTGIKIVRHATNSLARRWVDKEEWPVGGASRSDVTYSILVQLGIPAFSRQAAERDSFRSRYAGYFASRMDCHGVYMSDYVDRGHSSYLSRGTRRFLSRTGIVHSGESAGKLFSGWFGPAYLFGLKIGYIR